MANIEITNMSMDCIDEIMVIEKLSFKIPWSREAFLEEITKNKFAIYIVVKVDRKVAGYAGMWKIYDEGHITNIAVHPEYRRIGLGSLMMEKLIAISKENGIEKLTLEVRKGNFQAQSLYSKYGFVPEGLRKGYYADNNEDAIIMWKHGM